MKKKTIISSLLIGAITASILAGCGSGTDSANMTSATSSSSGNTTTASNVQEASSESVESSSAATKVLVDTKNIEGFSYSIAGEPSEYKIYCYWPAPDTFFDSYVLEGLKAFEEDYGVTIDYGIGTEWTQDVENQMVEAKLAEGYNLFYIFGADTTGANSLYKEIYDNGGYAINYAGLMNDPQQSGATLASDVYNQAYNSTKKLIDLMGGKGEIIDALENLNDINTQKRQQGVEDAVAENPDVSIAQTIGDISTADAGYEKISDAIAANAGVTGVITTGGTASIGLANAMKDYYATNPNAEHIYAASMDQSDEVMAGIDGGYIDYTVAQNGWAMGYVSPLLLCMMKDGYTPNEFGEFIDTGYIFIDKTNMDTWQTDIEKAATELIGKLQSDWVTKS